MGIYREIELHQLKVDVGMLNREIDFCKIFAKRFTSYWLFTFLIIAREMFQDRCRD